MCMRTNCDLLRCLDRSRCVSTSLFSMTEGVEWFSNSWVKLNIEQLIL